MLCLFDSYLFNRYLKHLDMILIAISNLDSYKFGAGDFPKTFLGAPNISICRKTLFLNITSFFLRRSPLQSLNVNNFLVAL